MMEFVILLEISGLTKLAIMVTIHGNRALAENKKEQSKIDEKMIPNAIYKRPLSS